MRLSKLDKLKMEQLIFLVIVIVKKMLIMGIHLRSINMKINARRIRIIRIA